MKKNYFLAAMFSLVFSVSLIAQTYVKQVIIGNGGIYGNPDDHVTVASYNPDDQTTTAFGDILRESIQDLIIHNNYVYVTAEDSICKFDIDSYQKVVSVFESNLHRLFYHEGFLFVSRRSDINGAPADGIYLKIYNAENLALVAAIEGISSDASGIIVAQDTAYVAVPGDWQATEGKFAVIDLGTYSLEREMNFGTEAVGIYDLFTDGEKIFTVNKSPYMATTGSITTYNVESASFSTNVINHVVGKGVSLEGNILYLGLDYGIGSYDVVSNQVLQNTIVPDPGSSTYIYIADAAFDNINQLFYVTITDYFSMGEGKIFDMGGNETGTFEADVSAEAIDFDYRINDFVYTNPVSNIKVFPNPFSNEIQIHGGSFSDLKVRNLQGQTVYEKMNGDSFDNKINLSNLKDGIYFLELNINNNVLVKKIVKK
ncbi:MAG: T9SS type A sorting domain-containing protein [Bacteroidales bacterium]|nr:T9SS type A sorting domain-containing protein [Bacteroidales bacterium]